MTQIIDGKQLATEIEEEIRQEIETRGGRPPALAVILVGDNGPSRIYVNRKTDACERAGIRSIKRHLDASITEDELLKEIEQLNVDPHIDGILVQLPLPDHINVSRVIRWISPQKDVDGFHPINVGKMLIGETDGFFPCTPLGIKVMIERYNYSIEGKHVAIIGRSNIVGKPLAALLMQRSEGANATVTVLHRFSDRIPQICSTADVLISAVGIPNLVTPEYVKDDAFVIDVGINRIEDLSRKSRSRLVGDVDFENVKDKCSYITPVPGGVGPMTIAMLLKNTLKSYQQHK